eukprot:scaffold52647_cov36-Prasinocladus_malaysianus.AAC.1
MMSTISIKVAAAQPEHLKGERGARLRGCLVHGGPQGPAGGLEGGLGQGLGRGWVFLQAFQWDSQLAVRVPRDITRAGRPTVPPQAPRAAPIQVHRDLAARPAWLQVSTGCSYEYSYDPRQELSNDFVGNNSPLRS